MQDTRPTAHEIAPKAVLSFGEFTLDTRRQELRRNGELVALNAQPLKVLWFLVSHADEVVTREALQRHVWGDVLVEYDQGINACIRQVRAALDDDADEPRFIRTLRGTGYRFVAPVRHVPAGVSRASGSSSRLGAWVRVAGASVFVLVATATWVIRQPSDSPPAAEATTTVAESEGIRVQGLEQLRRANYRPSLDSALALFNRSTRLAYSSASPIADWSIALSMKYRERGSDSAAALARRLLERAQALDSTGTETALAAGFVALYVRERVDLPLDHFRRAIEADSTRMLSWLGLGLTWREQGEMARALDALGHAARLDSTSELAVTELADALFQVRRFRDAEAVSTRFTMTPVGPTLALLRARLAIVRGDMTAAGTALESASPLSRDSLFARDLTVARIVGGVEPKTPASVNALFAETQKVASAREHLRRDVAFAEGLLRANRVDEALNRLTWLLANPSPLSLELVERDPLWARARETARYAELRQLWSR
jgi:DNA-binding winged helix-turn-helix (wHTH) protein/tetratricopeptide (TPR) repeat protein